MKTLTRRAQLVCDIPDKLSDENRYLDSERRFLTKTTTTPTLLNETLAELLNLTILLELLQYPRSPRTDNYVTRDEPNDCQLVTYIDETGRNLNTNERREMVMSTITLLNTIDWQITELTGTLRNVLPTYSTTVNILLSTTDARKLVHQLRTIEHDRCQQLPALYKWLTYHLTKQTIKL